MEDNSRQEMTEERERQIFASNLNAYMERDDISGVKLAEYMKVSSATISDWTKAKKLPRMNKIRSLANFFHIDMSDLTEDKGRIKQVPEIMKLYQQLSDENKEELIKRASELLILQSIRRN